MSRAPRITREDLEHSFRALGGDVQAKVDDTKQKAVPAVAVGGILFVLLVFLLGQRRGRRRSAVIEVRRF